MILSERARVDLETQLVTSRETGHGHPPDQMADIEHAMGTGHDDVLLGNSSPNRLNGRGGNDDIQGRAGADRLDGDYYWERFKAWETGSDRLDGGPDEDVVDGGPLKDKCVRAEIRTRCEGRVARGGAQPCPRCERAVGGDVLRRLVPRRLPERLQAEMLSLVRLALGP